MSGEIAPKESSAMVRARELNRTNEKRLSTCIADMSKEVEKSLEKLKIEGQTTVEFMKTLQNSSGKSDVSFCNDNKICNSNDNKKDYAQAHNQDFAKKKCLNHMITSCFENCIPQYWLLDKNLYILLYVNSKISLKNI